MICIRGIIVPSRDNNRKIVQRVSNVQWSNQVVTKSRNSWSKKKRGYLDHDNYFVINEKIFRLIYGKKIEDLWAEFCSNERLGERSYYVPNKIYSLEYDSFTYWLSKKRIKLCAPELNASLISRGLGYLEGIGIKNELY